MARPVFRGYDQAALDAEYNNRAKVRDAADWLLRYASESERARAELPCRLGLAYGPSAGETLDVFPAPGPGGAPVHVFIHGGYWHRLDKADFSFVARGLRPAGAAVVVINYALIPTVDIDELVRQCRASIGWVWRNAASFGGDPHRIFVSGHSAGGHLVAMLMSTEWTAFDKALPADVLKGGCGISGLYDLEPIRLCYLNEILKLTPAAAGLNSPVHHPPKRSSPLVLALGALEGPEYHRQSEELAAVWRSRELPCDVLDMAGHDHFSIVAELLDPKSTLSRRLAKPMGLV
jgi:arylformamidase